MEKTILTKIPSPLFYMILGWCPCLGITNRQLKNQWFLIRTCKIICHLSGLTKQDKKWLLSYAKSFNFIDESHLELEHDKFFLTIFYRNTHYFHDYIIIYF